MRVRGETLKSKPAFIDSTDNVFSFLPSKAGVGASTIALNAAVALSRQPNADVLLSDFDLNSGMMRFMLKLENAYSVLDVANTPCIWTRHCGRSMVTTIDKLDVLHAGKINPDFISKQRSSTI